MLNITKKNRDFYKTPKQSKDLPNANNYYTKEF